MNREQKKQSRAELLKLLEAKERENEQLRIQLSEAEAQLADRKIAISQAGSIAEAALQLNGVFEAAQAAADEYLETIRHLA